MLLFGKRKKNRVSRTLKESELSVENPGMGWYRPFLFDLSKEVDWFLLSTVIVKEERLCLLEILLSGYKEEAIPKDGLLRLEELLRYFREQGKDLLLRFAYDFDGKAYEKEPLSLQQVFTHMQQVAEVTAAFRDYIVLYQGLFVGAWGEMHSSRFTTDASILKLYDEFRLRFGRETCLAVRTVKQMELLEHAYGADENLTLYDDAIYGSASDMRTFTEGRKTEELRRYLSERNCPVGGEVLRGDSRITEEIDRYHLTYLNSQYEKQALKDWEEAGVLFEVNRRLGYRLLIRDLTITDSGKGTAITVTVENTGGGICIYGLQLGFVIGREIFQIPVSGRELLPGVLKEYRIETGKTIPSPEEGELFLHRAFDGTPLHMANAGLENMDGILVRALWEAR